MAFLNKLFSHQKAEGPKTPDINPNSDMAEEMGSAEQGPKISVPEKERSFEEDLQSISEALKRGEDVSPEKFAEMTGMDMEQYFRYTLGNEKFDIKEIDNFNTALQDSLSQEAEKYSDPSLIKRFLRSQTGRAAFVSLLLFLKFAPQGQAAEHHGRDNDPNKFRTEVRQDNNLEGGDGDKDAIAYYGGEIKKDATPESSPLEAADNFARLNLSNSFETDKAVIPEENQQKIQQQVDDFLAQINPQNFSDLMAHDFLIEGSSDQRATSNWPEGNYGLTKARIAAAEEIIQESIKNHDFSNSGLSNEQIAALQGRDFSEVIAESKSGPEKGVTYLTDLLNPATGKNFTAEDIKFLEKNDKAKYDSLLEQCRYIKVNLLAKATERPHDKIDPLVGRPAELKSFHHDFHDIVEKINGYQEVGLVWDNSPSMKESKDVFADNMAANNINTNVQVAYFSDQLTYVGQNNDLESAAQTLREVPNTGKSQEKAIACAITAVHKFHFAEGHSKHKLLLINTDEPLQDVSYEKLLAMQKIAMENNIDIKFNLCYFEGRFKQVAQVSLSKLIEQFVVTDGHFDRLKKTYERGSKNQRLSRDQRHSYARLLNQLDSQQFRIDNIVADDGRNIHY